MTSLDGNSSNRWRKDWRRQRRTLTLPSRSQALHTFDKLSDFTPRTSKYPPLKCVLRASIASRGRIRKVQKVQVSVLVLFRGLVEAAGPPEADKNRTLPAFGGPRSLFQFIEPFTPLATFQKLLPLSGRSMAGKPLRMQYLEFHDDLTGLGLS